MAVLTCPSCGYEGLLTVPEAAERAGVSDSTIRNWILQEGRLPVVREPIPGGYRYLVRVEDLDRLREAVSA